MKKLLVFILMLLNVVALSSCGNIEDVEYTLKYVDYDGVILYSGTFKEGDNLTTLSIPNPNEREYYDFIGWSIDLPVAMPGFNLEIVAEYEFDELAFIVGHFKENGVVEEVFFYGFQDSYRIDLMTTEGVNYGAQLVVVENTIYVGGYCTESYNQDYSYSLNFYIEYLNSSDNRFLESKSILGDELYAASSENFDFLGVNDIILGRSYDIGDNFEEEQAAIGVFANTHYSILLGLVDEYFQTELELDFE